MESTSRFEGYRAAANGSSGDRTVNFPAVGALLLLAFAACAPINAATMSERCRESYDACLDGCRPPQRSLPPESPIQPPPWKADLQIDTAACTDSCNKQAQTCR
jgi:hypothetical protein